MQDSVTSSLDSAVDWQARKLGSVALLEHILQGCSSETTPSSLSGPGRRRPLVAQEVPTHGLALPPVSVPSRTKQESAMELMQLLFVHFSGCIVPFDAVHEAAGLGKLKLLKFPTQHEIPAKSEGGWARIEAVEMNVVLWGRHHLARAAERKGNMEVVKWLALPFNAVRNGYDADARVALCQVQDPRWALEEGRVVMCGTFLAVWTAINARRLDIVERLIKLKLLEAGRALEVRYWNRVREQRYYPLTESLVRGMVRMQQDPPISEKTMPSRWGLAQWQGAGVLLATAGAESSKGFGDMADEAATPGGLNERVLQGNGGYGLVADQLDAIF
ncbi:Serine/threonine protein Kinase [Phytophthora cinnamomi]|uniref:Serine/threonine protein Kinase n=1 Tax=Phytophthora cinnamomi TaxID=4785 RepID=UPI00355A53FE|nr:Serine/threonine protein Kinase [Phytophthora cinnamomi]